MAVHHMNNYAMLCAFGAASSRRYAMGLWVLPAPMISDIHVLEAATCDTAGLIDSTWF